MTGSLLTRADHEALLDEAAAVVGGVVPAGAALAVVSGGDEGLHRRLEHAAWHFPCEPGGAWAGYHPADDAGAAELLEAARAAGAEFLAFPAAAAWWHEHYPEFAGYLERRYRLIAATPACRVFDLRSVIEDVRPPAPSRSPAVSAAPPAPTPPQGPGPADVRLIAFYLPQFHPIPENDAWWGEGFTDWSNVRRARPLFAGHRQPHLPGELGHYDLREPAVRLAQAELARAHGIDGFCYYHYWFGGRRLLKRPFDEVLASGQPEFPFCLCWANEPWSRRWDGGDGEVLQPQAYSRADDRAHIEWLLPALADPRAIRVDGRPVFLVYRARDLPDPARTAETWREAAARAGLPGLHLVAVETARDGGWDATQLGFDAKLHFAPQFRLLRPLERLHPTGAPATLRVYDYQQVWPALASPPLVDYRRYETVCPGWDNTARAGERGLVLHGSTPAAYETWLQLAVSRARERDPQHRLVFINAWNEWAEGCHLEPDAEHGRAYLEATRRCALVGA